MTPLRLIRRTRLALLSGASLATLALAQSAHAQSFANMIAAKQAQAGGAAPAAGGAPNSAGQSPLLVTPQQAQDKAAQSTADLQSAVTRIKGQLAAQAAARSGAQAASSNVPNGLAPGGLAPSSGIAADPTLWQFAQLPTQTVENGQTTVTVKQTNASAILNWESFNVGKDTTLHFDQSAGTDAQGKNGWVVLNRVDDPTARPSQILGKIKAEGSAYVINPNGVVFGGASQINVHSLIASSLYLYDTDRKVSDAKFLQGINAANMNAGTGSQALFNPQLLVSGPAVSGATVIEAGAEITTGPQGFSMIAGSNVTNAGSIRADDGQALLVAGAGLWLGGYGDVYPKFATPAFTDGNPISDPRLTSQNFEEQPDDFGRIVNTGIIQSARGAIDLLGAGSILQKGVLATSTSTTHAGSILISSIARYAAFASAPVFFEDGSLTAVLPDDGTTTLPTDAASLALFKKGQITVSGSGVDFKGGSLTYAPGQNINVSGGANRVLLEGGAVIDVAGLAGVEASVLDAIITVPRVGLNELADDPLQKGTFLYRNSITVDTTRVGVSADGVPWVGTPLANLQGYGAQIQKTVSQLLTDGGSITIGTPARTNPSGYPVQNAAVGEFVALEGSVLNLAGGYTRYAGADVRTTKLLGSDGRVYDIGSADPNITYVGFAAAYSDDHPRWVVSQGYTSGFLAQSTHVSDFIQGGQGGALSVYARGFSINGEIDAGSLAGERQVAGGALPQGGTLTMMSYGSLALTRTAPSLGADFNFESEPLKAATVILPTPGQGTNGPSAGLEGLEDSFSVLSTDAISAAGFSNLYLGRAAAGDQRGGVTPSGALRMDADAVLTVQPGGTVAMAAGGMINIDGQIHAQGGQITIESKGTLGGRYVQQEGLLDINIGDTAVLDVRGRWVNDFLAQQKGEALGGSGYLNAGSISLITDASVVNTGQPIGFDVWGPDQYGNPVLIHNETVFLDQTGSIHVADGAVLDLTGGGRIDSTGKLTGGKGGNLALSTYAGSQSYLSYYDLTAGYFSPPPAPDDLNLPFDAPTNATIDVKGKIFGDSLAGGGALSIQAPSIRIGGGATGTKGEFYVPEAMFTNGQGLGQVADRGGLGGMFGAYSFTSTYGGITVADGAQVVLKQQTLKPTEALLGLQSGGDIGALNADGSRVNSLWVAPDISRPAVNLSLTSRETYNFHPETKAYLALSTRGAPLDNAAYIDIADAQFGIERPAADPLLLIGEGVQILGDPRAKITLTADQDIINEGLIRAEGGVISMTAGLAPLFVAGPTDNYATVKYQVGGVWLTSTSALDVSGTVIADTTKPGFGAVGKPQAGGGLALAGGSVSLTAPYIFGEEGGLIDVSGASGVLNRPASNPQDPTAPTLAPQTVWSDAGAVSFNAGAGAAQVQVPGVLRYDGVLKAAAGQGEDASQHGHGGVLNVTVGGPAGQAAPLIEIQQSGATAPLGFVRGEVIPADLAGHSILTVETLAGSGVETLNLVTPSAVVFKGPVELDLGRAFTIDARSIQLEPESDAPAADGGSPQGSTVRVEAPVIELKNHNPFNENYAYTPVAQSGGELQLSGAFIALTDNVAINDAAQTSLTSSGDIRLSATPIDEYPNGLGPGKGSLVVQGDLTLKAGQVYPTSGATFTLQSPGTITILANGPAPAAPLSAGGVVNIYGKDIVQAGVLRAPFGQLNLGAHELQMYDSQGQPISFSTDSLTLAAGSLTSVSGDGLTVPYGTTVDELDWFFVNRTGISLKAPPEKRLQLNGESVTVEAGATVDLSGGGELYATEFVQGTGGSRDVLSRYTTNTVTGNPVGEGLYAQFPDSRDIYAIVPGAQPDVAPYDPDFATFYKDGQTLKPGMSVYLSGAEGLPAGVYTLLPGHYATLPGAYRVVLASGADTYTAADNATLADGTQLVAGAVTDSFTGARPSGLQLFSVQSGDVWSKYSEYKITDADAFFPAHADRLAIATPRLPADAGRLVLNAQQNLNIDERFVTAPGKGGRGALADITGAKIQITAPGQTADDGFVAFDATSLNAINATSLLIGGVRSAQNGVTLVNGDLVDTLLVTPTATDILVTNDANSALKAPEILLVVGPSKVNVDISADQIGLMASTYQGDSSIVLRPGATVIATGDVTGAQPSIIRLGQMDPVDFNGAAIPFKSLLPQPDGHGGYNTYGYYLTSLYSVVGSGAGSLLRVSNGDQVRIDRGVTSLPGYTSDTVFLTDYFLNAKLPPAQAPASVIEIAAGAVLDSNGSVTLDTTGDAAVAPDLKLNSPDVSLAASSISLDATGSAPASGLVVSPALLAQLVNASALRFHSYGDLDVFGDVNVVGAAGRRISALTLDAARIVSHGGQLTLDAAAVVLSNSNSDETFGVEAGAGGLSLTSETLLLDGGDVRLSGFDTVALGGRKAISLAHTGALSVGAADLTLNTPLLLALSGSNQTIRTTGDVKVITPAGLTPAPAPQQISSGSGDEQPGGVLTIDGGSIQSDAAIQALAGLASLHATRGDIQLTGGGVYAGGYGQQFFDVVKYAPGGFLTLTADNGSVRTAGDAVLDVSASPFGGDAGSVVVYAPKGTASLAGKLGGVAASGALGANFTLNVAQGVELDPLAQRLSTGGFSGDIDIRTGAGDLALSGALHGANVYLTADGGAVRVTGAIDASGDRGGSLELYGRGGVVLGSTARLIARGADPEKLGGDIVLGSAATAVDGVNDADGSQKVISAGAIQVAAGAVLDVSGGSNAGLIGGTVVLRAPILADGAVNVAFDGQVVGARSKVLEAYRTWATSDASAGPKHFDGIIDAGGLFNADGSRVDGAWYGYLLDPNYPDKKVYQYDPATGLNLTAQIGYQLGGVRYDMNGEVVADQADGFFAPDGAAINQDHRGFYQGTLMQFVQNPGVSAPAGFDVAPGVELKSDTLVVNNGDITLASNWNLGAGGVDAEGRPVLFYRNGDAPGVLTLRAVRDINVNASLTDGFFHTGNQFDPEYIGAVNTYFAHAPAGGLFYQKEVIYKDYWGPGQDLVSLQDVPSSFLGAPAAPAQRYDSSDPAYNAAAQTYYTVEYPAYMQAYVNFRAVAAKPGSKPTNDPAYTPPAPPRRADFASYADYLDAYATSYLPAFQAVLDACGGFCLAPVAPVPPAAPPPPVATAQFDLARPDSFYGANGAAANPTIYNPAPIASAELFGLRPDANGQVADQDGTRYAAIQSWSYRIAAGAGTDSANPMRLAPLGDFTDPGGPLAGHGDVILSGHTEYAFPYQGAASTNGVRAGGLGSVTPTTIRTGTGSIDIAAGRNLAMTDTLAPGVIYTAGRRSGGLDDAGFRAETVDRGYYTGIIFTPENPAGFHQASGPLAYPSYCDGSYSMCGQSFLYQQPVYPEAGGDLTIRVQNDVLGFQNVMDVHQNLTAGDLPMYNWQNVTASLAPKWTDWLLSTGSYVRNSQNQIDDATGVFNPNYPYIVQQPYFIQPAWWVNFGSFNQGVGALGGGDVTIIADGDVSQLGVSLPTTGRVSGGLSYSLADGSRNLPTVDLHGGGDLLMRVRGDLLSGSILVGKGDGVVVVGGGVKSGFTVPPDPVTGASAQEAPIQIALQDGRVRLVASTSVTVGDVSSPFAGANPNLTYPYAYDPVLVAAYGSQMLAGAMFRGSNYSTFSGDSAISITSAGGDVNYRTQAPTPPFGQEQQPNSPASLELVSLRGDLNLVGGFILTPSEGGTLTLDAGHNIYLGAFQGGQPVDAYIDPVFSTGPSVIPSGFDPTQLLLGFNGETNVNHLLHVDDPTPEQIFALNDIQGGYSSLTVTKKADIRAGRDIINLSFFGQNLHAGDVTDILAGRDITRTQVIGQNGVVAIGNNLSLAGPGVFDVEAGRYLGPFVTAGSQSTRPSGIVTTGNFSNPELPAQSARIIALAGIAKGVDYAAMIDRYLDPSKTADGAPNYLGELVAYLEGMGVETSGKDDAWAKFQALTPFQQRIFLSEVFFAELDTGATASPNYSRGYTAVNTMFPAAYGYTRNNLEGGENGANELVQTGDIDLRQSTIQTQQGGDISLFAPGGTILVGSQSASASQSNPAFTGIITLAGGDIFTFSDKSVLVNQSRVFTEQGGLIEMFSANGDLDAGRGAKTTASLPPPIYLCDARGFCYIDPRGLVTGAGIATLQSIPGAPPGDVHLMAPRGTVNAGDAGIRVSGNLVIAAMRVLNADNIEVQGEAIGLPPKPVTNLALATTDAATKEAAAAASAAQSSQRQMESIVTVEVTGFGGVDDSCENPSTRSSRCPR